VVLATLVWHDEQMGPVEVAAGVAVFLAAVVGIGVWVAATRRRTRRRDEVERRHEAMVRAQVLERLARVTAEWEGPADHDVTGANATDADANADDATLTDTNGADAGSTPEGGRPAA
jgi:hypothetical protein